jgi:hypothetical protein
MKINKKTLRKSNMKEIEDKVLHYGRAKNFLHCRGCMEYFIESPLHEHMTPRDWGMYEASTYVFTYPGGKKGDIIVFWCKRCSKPIWDSRNMLSSY